MPSDLLHILLKLTIIKEVIIFLPVRESTRYKQVFVDIKVRQTPRVCLETVLQTQ